MNVIVFNTAQSIALALGFIFGLGVFIYTGIKIFTDKYPSSEEDRKEASRNVVLPK